MKLETIDDVLKLNTLCGIQDKAKADPRGKTMGLLVNRLTQCGIRDKVEEIINSGGTPEELKSLRFTNTGNTTATISFNNKYLNPDFEYNLNSSDNWTVWDYSAISLEPGEWLELRGDNANEIASPGPPQGLVMTGTITASGSLMSLAHKELTLENITSIPKAGWAYGLFSGCTSLTGDSNIVLPATTLTSMCYANLFYGCSNLSAVTVMTTADDNPDVNNPFNNWLTNTSPTGTLYCPASMIDTWNSLKGQNSGIPSGWSVEEYIPAN